MTDQQQPNDDVEITDVHAQMVLGFRIDLRDLDPRTGLPTLSIVTDEHDMAKQLTHELVDQVMNSVHPSVIEAEAMSSAGVGQKLNIAARTHDAIREALHDLV